MGWGGPNTTSVRRLLRCFHAIACNSNCQRPLNELHRYDQALIAIFRFENSFQAIEASSSNADLLPDTQERMAIERNAALEDRLYGFDLGIRNGDPDAPNSHKAANSRRAKHRAPHCGRDGDADKNVSGKDWHVNQTPPVSPLVVRGKQRHESLNLPSP